MRSVKKSCPESLRGRLELMAMAPRRHLLGLAELNVWRRDGVRAQGWDKSRTRMPWGAVRRDATLDSCSMTSKARPQTLFPKCKAQALAPRTCPTESQHCQARRGIRAHSNMRPISGGN